MKRVSSKYPLILALAASAQFFAPRFLQSQGLFYTDTARFAAQSTVPPDGPPLQMVTIGSLSDAGRTFNNRLSGLNGMGQIPAGTLYNIVGATPIDTAKVGGASGGFNQSGILSPGGQQMVAVFGLRGVVTADTSPGSSPTLLLQSGKVQVTQITPGTFSQNDVGSWGFNNGVLAVYTLKPQEQVVPGSPFVDAEPRFVPASQTNVASGNLALGADIQIAALFEELPALGWNLLDSEDADSSGQSDLLEALIAAGLATALKNEAVFFDGDEEITGFTESVLSPAEQAIVNAISQFGIGSDFATFGSGTQTDYIVTLANIFAGGDFATDLGGNFIPGLQVISEPEPASILGWSAIALIGGCLAWRRRRSQLRSR